MDVRGTILLARRDKGTFFDVFQMIIKISPSLCFNGFKLYIKRNISRPLGDWTAGRQVNVYYQGKERRKRVTVTTLF